MHVDIVCILGMSRVIFKRTKDIDWSKRLLQLLPNKIKGEKIKMGPNQSSSLVEHPLSDEHCHAWLLPRHDANAGSP